jgi:hypothetical protein
MREKKKFRNFSSLIEVAMFFGRVSSGIQTIEEPVNN